jgi:serine/threonine-protein kinase
VRISPRLERILMKALERDPDARFQSADEMALALERHAFASEGFNPTQIATAMKTLFAADFARWRRTVSAAMDLGSKKPDAWGDTSGTFLRAPSIELRSRGATMALHPMVNLQETGPLTGSTREQRSDSRSAQSEFTLPDLPPRPRAGWFVGGALALMATFALGALAFTRTGTTVTVVQPARGEIVAVPMASPLAVPVSSAATGASTALPATATPQPLVAGEELSATTPITPAAPISETLAARPTGAKTNEDTLRAAWAGVEARPAPRARPGKTASRVISPRPADAHHSRAVASSLIVDPWAPVRAPAAAATTASESKEACSVRLGTQPWAEVWMDGKKTGRHTPYLDNVSCGVHTVTFKRADLGRSKTYTITARPGEPLRQSFPFE